MTEPAIQTTAGDAPRDPARKPRVALFVTCLVDLFRPSVGFAAIKLMEDAGCLVEVPEAQVCCGQPAYNSGDRKDTTAIARQVIDAFRGYDYVVAPSGSCAGMIRDHYPPLFAAEPDWKARADDLSSRTYELTSFLVDVLNIERVDAPALNAKITYHDSCSGLRELGVKQQPRKLLQNIGGIDLVEMKTPETCCGFGGTFCVKYGEVSTDIVSRKTADIKETGAELLLAGDMGCLLNMAGRLQREGSSVKARHVAEVLAGMTDVPPIGESSLSEAK